MNPQSRKSVQVTVKIESWLLQRDATTATRILAVAVALLRLGGLAVAPPRTAPPLIV